MPSNPEPPECFSKAFLRARRGRGCKVLGSGIHVRDDAPVTSNNTSDFLCSATS